MPSHFTKFVQIEEDANNAIDELNQIISQATEARQSLANLRKEARKRPCRLIDVEPLTGALHQPLYDTSVRRIAQLTQFVTDAAARIEDLRLGVEAVVNE